MAPRSNRRAGMKGASSSDAMDVKGGVVAALGISVKDKDDSGAIKEIVVETANGKSFTCVVENPRPGELCPKCSREFRSDDEYYCGGCGWHRQGFSDRRSECTEKFCTKCGEKRGRVRPEFGDFVGKVFKDAQDAGDLPAGVFTLEEDQVKEQVRTIIEENYDIFEQEMKRVGMDIINDDAIFDYVRSRQKHLRKKAKKGAAARGNIVQQEVNAEPQKVKAEPQKVKAEPQEVKQTKGRKTK